MNARQKAKKYKRLYEELSKQLLPVIFKEPYQIDTLRFEKCYPDELLRNSPERSIFASAYILKDITQGLAEGLNKYIVYRTDYDPTTNTDRVCGELKVVNR